jgi:ParB family chromosome partitioning protein
MKRKALGKGLSALLPEPEPTGPVALEAPVESLEPNPYQPRAAMEPQALAALAASLAESGMVQPILVRRHGSGYQIIAGERRARPGWTASRSPSARCRTSSSWSWRWWRTSSARS